MFANPGKVECKGIKIAGIFKEQKNKDVCHNSRGGLKNLLWVITTEPLFKDAVSTADKV